ncbi:MAG: carboxymuconolactone decarboxylase family protein, partial [Actinobacteria bacterium]
MTAKTDISRFDIHDELTAPEETARLLRGMSDAGGSVSKFVGVLAGSPAAMRAFARMRHELRGGVLPRRTAERIALAVAESRGDTYSVAQHAKTARAAGLGLDEISRARSWTSTDPR